jgi:hydroxyacylglutathione hydrolase
LREASAAATQTVTRSHMPSWLSNAYLLAEGRGGHGVLVDANGIAEPLLERIERDRITVTHVLLTHAHGDHVAGIDDYRTGLRVPVVAHELAAGDAGQVDEVIGDDGIVRSGSLEIRALHTPGHAAGHLAFVVDDAECLTGDVLFRRTVGGTRGGGRTGFVDLRRSIMDRLMALPAETRVHPGHREPTTIGEEWESNPFIRVWRGLDEEGSERCRVSGEEATLILWARDYDGGYKAWVRYPSGEDMIVGGSQVERR